MASITQHSHTVFTSKTSQLNLYIGVTHIDVSHSLRNVILAAFVVQQAAAAVMSETNSV